MSEGVSKAAVERELLEAWEALGSAVDSFSDREMEQPGAVDEWSGKDLLGHIAFWARQAAANLSLVAEGKQGEIRRPDTEAELDEWNEREWRARKDHDLAAAREDWLSSFDEAMQALAAFPSERLQEKVRGADTPLKLFAEDTYEHYREHRAHLVAWRRSLETTET